MNNKSFIAIIATLVLVIIGLILLNDYSKKNEASESPYDTISGIKKDFYYLFVGETCPHCRKVEEFIQENKLKESLDIKILEVTFHEENVKFYDEAEEKCQENLGGSVPVLYHNEKCILGDTPIIDELRKISEKKDKEK
ncbi:MAG: hypothetical protein GF335_00715 [Candidatus Moranbacteria bacterium]|nr:hypothetical protein [Candidatus Moranbacteria bacterium]